MDLVKDTSLSGVITHVVREEPAYRNSVGGSRAILTSILMLTLAVRPLEETAEVQYRIHKGYPVIPILSQINPIPRIDTYFFKINSVGLGGLRVTCSPRDLRFASSNPAEVDGFFEDVKLLSTYPPVKTLSWGSRV